MCEMNVTKESTKIIIVGAGASGIAAASRLFQNGFKNITILEAEGRVGGRIFTKEFGGYWVDVGAQWVHGEEDNAVYDLAWHHGILEKSSGDSRRRILNSSGSAMPEETGESFLHFFKTLSGSSIPREHLQVDSSIGDHYKPKIEAYFEEHPEITRSQRKPLTRMLNLFQMASDAEENWSSVSTRGINEYVYCKGDNMINWKDKGFGTIIDILMKRFPNSKEELPIMKNIVLNDKVKLINYSKFPVDLVTEKGKKYKADHVIVTTSLGVLKCDQDTLFTPPLSESKCGAIKNIEFGSVAKIFLYFPEPWWLDSAGNSIFGSALSFYWTEEDWDEISKDPVKSWMRGIFNLILVEHKPRLMCAWLAGPYAREMEKIPEERLFDQMKEFLRRFLGKTYKITEPTEMLRTQWSTNPNFRGTYAYRSLETERSAVTMKQLAEPINNDGKLVVLFAGEATSWDQYASAHGAIASGWREADRLINFYDRR